MPDTVHAPETVTIRDAAEGLGVHENTVRNYLNKHLLGYVQRPSGHRRVLKADLERLQHEMFAGPPAVVDELDERLLWRNRTAEDDVPVVQYNEELHG